MSSGAWEYVMGVYSNTVGSSGISTWPEEKYYDNYTTTSETTACNSGVCYGHALSETSGWYSDTDYFVRSSSPWFGRGGSYGSTSSAGVFCFYVYDGSARTSSSFRVSLVGA